jgi:hypothetical protein
MGSTDTTESYLEISAGANAHYEHDIPLSIARAAHGGTSFSPEIRADSERQNYAATLRTDFAALSKLATTDEKRATLIAEFARYRAGYRSRYLAMLLAKSRCMSTMITGGSNFPVARNRKRGAVADKRTSEVIDWREGAIAAIRKALTPELRPVMAGDDDAVERLTAKIAKAEKFQADAKAINAATRKRDPIAALTALGYSEATARELLKLDAMGNIGVPSYQLTNNNANLRRMKARLAAISVAKVTEATEVVGSRARLEDNAAENRVRLYFPGKPDAETRGRLKSLGFRWTPSLGCWQAYRSNRTIEAAKRETGEPCAASQNGMSECDDDHKARGVACGVCVPTTEEV